MLRIIDNYTLQILCGAQHNACNEEAKINGMEGNRKVCGDIIAGTFLIAGGDGCGGTTDLTDEQIAKYTKMFEADESYTPEEVEGSAGFYIVGFD